MIEKKYVFETSNQPVRGIIIMGYFIISVLLIGWIGVTFQNVTFSLTAFFILTVIGFYIYKFTFRAETQEITFSEKGIFYRNQMIGWRLIRNYRIDLNSKDIDTIRIITWSNKNIILYFDLKKCKGIEDWNRLKSDLPNIMEDQENPVPNYYNSPAWDYVLVGTVVLSILFPILIFALKLPIKSSLPALLILYGSITPLFITILTNRKKKK